MSTSLSIRARLIAGTVIAMLGLLSLAAFNAYSNRVNVAALQDVYQRDVRMLVSLQKLDTTLKELRFRVAGVLLDTLPATGSLNHLRDARGQLSATWGEVRDALSREGAGEKHELSRQVVAGWAGIEGVLAKIEAGYAAKDTGKLTDVLDSDWPTLHATVTKPLSALLPLIEADAKATYEAAQRHARTLSAAAAALAATMLGALCAVMLWLGRSIDRSLSEADRAVGAIAAGDLTQPIDASGRDEIGRFLGRLRHMQAELRGVVAGVRAGVDQVGTATREIAQGNLDLSTRTEQQALSLQQTAASMQTLTASVSANAQNARQAAGLAGAASEVASRGGEVVGRVVSTMQGISESSRRIGDIIGVIDGIAFQTNILALNAAVEAARAGEQGRGFAVVASEVRGLAQRSADAAREIKALIVDALAKVDDGSRLVGDAGTTMGEIVAQVRRASDLIEEITAATVEQSSGIARVNEAVVQLDTATQQNAALVEEGSAASEHLREQAAQLAASVSVFRI